MTLKKYDASKLIELCKNSYSYAEVLRKLEKQPSGGNYETLKRKIRDFNINISHFTHKIWTKSPNKIEIKRKSSLKEKNMFCQNSKHTNKTIRDYIKRNNILPYECQFCKNQGLWMNQKIPLELDHINGDRFDNRLENLRFLCPNCHALTSTYRGRNKKSECREFTPTT